MYSPAFPIPLLASRTFSGLGHPWEGMRAPSVCVAEAPAAHPGDGFSGAPDLEPGLLLPATPHSRLPQEAPLPQTRLLTSLSLPPAGAGFTEKPKNEEVNKLPDSNHTRLSAGGGAADRAEGRPLGRVHPPGVPGAQGARGPALGQGQAEPHRTCGCH